MRRAGASEGLFYLCRAAQHFLLATKTDYSAHLQPEDATKGCPAHKALPQNQETSTADLCSELKVSIKHFNRCVLCFGAARGRKRRGTGRRHRLGLDLYCRNYLAMADLQISPFSAAQAANPPPFCSDAARDSKTPSQQIRRP